MNILWWIRLASHSISLIAILILFTTMIFAALDDIWDRWRWHKRRKEIREYEKQNRQSQEQLNKPNKPVDNARQGKGRKKRGNPELPILAFFLGLLLGVLFQGIVA